MTHNKTTGQYHIKSTASVNILLKRFIGNYDRSYKHKQFSIFLRQGIKVVTVKLRVKNLVRLVSFSLVFYVYHPDAKLKLDILTVYSLLKILYDFHLFINQFLQKGIVHE